MRVGPKLRAARRRKLVRFQAKQEKSIFSETSIPTLGPRQPPVQRLQAAVYTDAKRPQFKAGHLSLPSAEVKKACCLIQHKDNIAI